MSDEYPSESHPLPGEGYWYMAGPYSDDPAMRYQQHLEVATVLTRAKLTIYSPIIHYHEMSHVYNMPTHAAFWEEHNYNMMVHSRGVILACLSNWAASKGVRNELAFSKLKSIPVWALDPPSAQSLSSFEGTILNWTRML